MDLPVCKLPGLGLEDPNLCAHGVDRFGAARASEPGQQACRGGWDLSLQFCTFPDTSLPPCPAPPIRCSMRVKADGAHLVPAGLWAGSMAPVNPVALSLA